MNLIKRLFRKTAPAPMPFPEVNFTYMKPEGMTDQQCGALPCFRSETFTVSCWQLSPRDRLRCLIGGKVWLMLMMNGHPPVCVTPDSPFPKPEVSKQKNRTRWFWIIVILTIQTVVFFWSIFHAR